MRAVVLAAGKGTRLGQLAEAIPKPMLPVAGRPIIHHVLGLLARSGVEEVFMNLHHLPHALTEYCGDGSRWNLRITYAVELRLLGTAGAVRNFGRYLGGAPFFVVYGDNYLKCDLGRLWAFHAECRALATIALFHKDVVTGSGIVEVDERGQVRRFLEKPRPAEVFSHLVNGGLYVLSPDILPLIPETGPSDFGHDVLPALLAGGHPIFGKVMDGMAWGIDTPELYEQLCALVEHERC